MILKISDNNICKTSGNKAKFLQIMKTNGFNVPDGIILDKNVYIRIVKYNNIEEKISETLAKINTNNVDEISKEISSLFNNITIPQEISNEINAQLDESKKYAVRSSGIKEDLDNFSFAGQYETFLNISGQDNILNAIISCYKSMYSKTILSYCINNNVSFDNFFMSVVIQEMVNSEKSGIAFTINVMTGNDKEFVIEIANGLGENIVSGKVIPKRYIYNWYENRFENKEEENKEILVEENEINMLCEKLLELQMYFGFPIDIEFAFEKGQLYILQARPITKVVYSKIPDQWTTADFKDGGVSATVCTPYMWSLYEYIWEIELKKFFIDSNILKEKEFRKLGDMFYGRPYWNLSIVKMAMARVPGYKEREFDNEFGVKITYTGDGQTTKITPKSIFNIINIAIKQKQILNDRKLNNEKYKKDLLDRYNKYIQNYNRQYDFEQMKKVWYKLIKHDYLYSEGTYFWQIFINTIHQSIFKDSLLKYVTYNEYFNLLGGLDNISHLLPFYEMWDITREILKDEQSKKYWLETSLNNIINDYAKNINRPFFKQVNEYIQKYGYHSNKELDVTYPCYFEDVDTVIKTFKDTVMLDDSCNPEIDRNRQKDKFENQMKCIKEKVTESKYKKVSAKIEEMRNMLWWREEFRDVSTRFYYVIRIYTIKLANQFVKEGIINNVDDIWYLKIGNIFDYIDDKINKDDLNNIIIKNKKYYNSFRNYTSENEIGCIFDKDAIKSESKKNDNTVIAKGIGCSNGEITGVARVIESLDEIDKLQLNDILITKFTDTGWTSKFAILNGVVTEYGGILCHAAIVSREYGIPCIVCTEGATKKIKDGTIITINATTGEIKEG